MLVLLRFLVRHHFGYRITLAEALQVVNKFAK
jgi:hypothetical protein